MKKLITILASFAVLSCAPKDPVRTAIEQEVISGLADPKSYKFVSYELEQEINPEREALRVVLNMIKYESVERNEGESVYDYLERSEAAWAAYNAKGDKVKELAASMPADAILSRIYKFDYRADVPGRGRDFPVEVFALLDTENKCLGIAPTIRGALDIPVTSVSEFIPFTE